MAKRIVCLKPKLDADLGMLNKRFAIEFVSYKRLGGIR